VIPAQDYTFLYDHGAAAVFGPGTPVPRSAALLLEKLGAGGVD
jgi:methylmalonyl-CoA mutase